MKYSKSGRFRIPLPNPHPLLKPSCLSLRRLRRLAVSVRGGLWSEILWSARRYCHRPAAPVGDRGFLGNAIYHALFAQELHAGQLLLTCANCCTTLVAAGHRTVRGNANMEGGRGVQFHPEPSPSISTQQLPEKVGYCVMRWPVPHRNFVDQPHLPNGPRKWALVAVAKYWSNFLNGLVHLSSARGPCG